MNKKIESSCTFWDWPGWKIVKYFIFFLQITIQFIDKIITSDNHLDLSGAAHMQLVLHTTAITSAHQISDPKLCFSLDQ